MVESGIQAICNPLISIHLQGRHDSYPKRGGLTRVPELIEGGVNVVFGHDCAMDPWYPMGRHDMLEVDHMGAHCLQMMGNAQVETVYGFVTGSGAKIMQLEDYGIEVGKKADLVILQAYTPLDAIRLKPARLHVIRAGKCITSTLESTAEVVCSMRGCSVDFLPLPE